MNNLLRKVKDFYKEYKTEIGWEVGIIIVLSLILVFSPLNKENLLDGTFLIGALAVPITVMNYVTSKRNEFYTDSLSRLETLAEEGTDKSIQIRLLQLSNIYNQGNKSNVLFKEAVEEAYMKILFNNISREHNFSASTADKIFEEIDLRIEKTPQELSIFKNDIEKLMLDHYNICWKNSDVTEEEYKKAVVFYESNINDFDKKVEVQSTDEDKYIISSTISTTENCSDKDIYGVFNNYNFNIDEKTTINGLEFDVFKTNLLNTTDGNLISSNIKYKKVGKEELSGTEIRKKYSAEGYVMITGETIENNVRWYKIPKKNYERNINNDIYFFYKISDSTYSGIVINSGNFKELIQLKEEDAKYGDFAIDKNGAYNFYLKLDTTKNILIDRRFKNNKYVELTLEN